LTSARAPLQAAVAAGVALAMVLAPTPLRPDSARAAGPAQASLSPDQLGANTGVLFNGRRYSQAEIDAQLAALARTGAKVVRSDALWEATEPEPPIVFVHRYDWSFDDLVVYSLASHGLRWLPIIDYSARWAQSSPGHSHSAPSSVSGYGAYAGALAGRYGPGGTFWLENPELTPVPVQTYEIWNEPDNPQFWYPAPDPSLYASLYTSARAEIGWIQPGAQVIVGGLMHPQPFVSEMVAANPSLRGQIGGVGIHPYGSKPRDVLANVRAARGVMRSSGLGSVPLYVTELGWTTSPRRAPAWAPKWLRPSYIGRTLSALGHTDCNIAALSLYAWVTPERNPAHADDWYGIARPGGGGSADTAAFASGLAAAATPRSTSSLCAARRAVANRKRSRRRARRHH
jgi:hypothetical protein